MANWTEIIFWSVEVVFNVILTVLIFRAQGWRDVMQTLKKDLAEASKELIEARFGEIQQRLKDGEFDLEKLSEQDQRAEVKFTKTVGDLKMWMLENFAGKEDLRRHESSVDARQRAIDEKLAAVAVDVAVLASEKRRHGDE